MDAKIADGLLPERTECSQRTSAKVSYFTSGQDFQPDCQFTVEALNDNICQMR
jgi:hypothetical protein